MWHGMRDEVVCRPEGGSGLEVCKRGIDVAWVREEGVDLREVPSKLLMEMALSECLNE